MALRVTGRLGNMPESKQPAAPFGCFHVLALYGVLAGIYVGYNGGLKYGGVGVAVGVLLGAVVGFFTGAFLPFLLAATFYYLFHPREAVAGIITSIRPALAKLFQRKIP